MFDEPWYWNFTVERDNNGNATGNYFIKNKSNGKYLSIPDSSSDSNLVTTVNPTSIGLKITYPTFGEEISPNRLKPTSYYLHFVNPEKTQNCAYSDNTNLQSISWSSNIGIIFGYPQVPLEQQQREILYECGADPTKIESDDAVRSTPNLNYRFNVNAYCINDYNVCFTNDGKAV
jgi:hypothetical protein